MKLILSVFMLASVVIFAFSESHVAEHAGSEGFLSDSLLTEADLDEIERRIAAIPSLEPAIAEGAIAAKDASPTPSVW